MGTLPFHVGPLARRDSHAFPARLPFCVGFDDALGLITQVHDAHTLEVLRQVYAAGSQLGIPMGDQGLGKAYAEGFQGAIERWLGDRLRGAALLEIGCGSGHLLAALADAGAAAEGVEPDPRCRAAMQQRGIPVTTAEFEAFQAPRAYDCIVHYCVLEHAVDPVAFLAAQRELLAPDGRIILAVPDCGGAIAQGDISMFIHQHWSYFTGESLWRLARAAGLRVLSLQPAEVGGLLYAELATADMTTGTEPAPGGRQNGGAASRGDDAGSDVAEAAGQAAAFVERARGAVARLDEYVASTTAGGRTLGIYCPSRAINYVPEENGAWRGIRLFDDAPRLLGRYMPPFAAAVENREGLVRDPVDEVLIMSRAFGAAIEAAIAAQPMAQPPCIRHIDDVLSHE
jgi:2-polyprenyl-3-methyl-5-hydroxy-6-metoxy-1,4-benzoquinol methylase